MKTTDIIKKVFAVLTAFLSVFFFIRGITLLNGKSAAYSFSGTAEFIRVTQALEEDYSDETVCPVEFSTADGRYTCVKNYSFEEWEALPSGERITGYIYTSDEGTLAFPQEADESDLAAAVKDIRADEAGGIFGFAIAAALTCAGLAVISIFGRFFTPYEQIWFLSILIAASAVSVLVPEEDCNGVNGLVIMGLYLADTFLNILCELLISKQSKWNFIVSVFVEITEIAICVVLSYRFATLASTLFFWLPCDIVSFINWHKHPDRAEEELTEVRSLRGWQEAAILAGVAVWTVGVGFFLTTLDFGTDIFGGNRTLEIIVCFLDACASAVGIVNGVFILLRLREQWIAWYISAVLEGVINVLSGQFVLLVLKFGYITNTTYGYIKWTKYIKQLKETTKDA